MECKIFYCYSRNLKNFILSRGVKYISKSIHEKTGKKYWIFIGDENLNNLLNEWKNNK